MGEKEKLFRSNEGDKERKLGKREAGRGRKGKRKRETEMEREGLVDPARYQEPPLPVAPISTPTLYTPRASKEYMHSCVRWLKTHTTIDVARP